MKINSIKLEKSLRDTQKQNYETHLKGTFLNYQFNQSITAISAINKKINNHHRDKEFIQNAIDLSLNSLDTLKEITNKGV